MNTHNVTKTIEYALAVFRWRVLGETRAAYNGLTFPGDLIEQTFQKFQSTISFDLKQKFNGRLERGLEIAMTGGVMPDKDLGKLNGYFKVRSSNPNNPLYLVDLHQRSCTCPNHWKGHFCKHRIAANIINIASTLNKAETPAPVPPQNKSISNTALPASSKDTQIELPKALDDAVIWGDGTLGVFGEVSALNSLVGSTAGDQVGSMGCHGLINSNFVVGSPYWDNGTMVDTGAVTWGDGDSGIIGEISSTNSLVGSNANDRVGLIHVLSNGNYLVGLPGWDNGPIIDVGAVTWGDGDSGVTGMVSVANSLVGRSALIALDMSRNL